MAERINSLSPVARPRIYPWSAWLDGNAWRIRRGVDFEVTAASMAGQIRLAAAREGGNAACRVTDGGEAVEFQFYAREAA